MSDHVDVAVIVAAAAPTVQWTDWVKLSRDIVPVAFCEKNSTTVTPVHLGKDWSLSDRS